MVVVAAVRGDIYGAAAEPWCSAALIVIAFHQEQLGSLRKAVEDSSAPSVTEGFSPSLGFPDY